VINDVFVRVHICMRMRFRIRVLIRVIVGFVWLGFAFLVSVHLHCDFVRRRRGGSAGNRPCVSRYGVELSRASACASEQRHAVGLRGVGGLRRGWGSALNWIIPATPSAWCCSATGITCGGADGRVTEIRLRSKQLTGMCPRVRLALCVDSCTGLC
jgi:hypothetical protein